MGMFNKGIAPALVLILAALPVHAEFYKWVDDHGVTQYSQRPPPAGHYQEMKMRAPTPSDEGQQAQPKAQDKQPKQDSKAAAPPNTPPDKLSPAERQAAMRQNCQLARERLSQLASHGRVRYTAADGSVRVMSEEERQAKLAESRKMANEMCQ